MDVAPQPHPIAHLFGDPAHQHQQQSLLHVLVAPDLWSYAARKPRVDVLLIFQGLDQLSMHGEPMAELASKSCSVCIAIPSANPYKVAGHELQANTAGANAFRYVLQRLAA